MRTTLVGRNEALRRDMRWLFYAVSEHAVPRELEAYRARVSKLCEDVRAEAEQNLRDLAFETDDLLEDVLSNTHRLSWQAQLLSAELASPILRASSADRLSLRTIEWLHAEHAATAGIPAAFTDGHTAVLPLLNTVPIYSLPCVEQQSLLFQPLIFHEFGHLLYALHEPEMDDLVRDLQQEISIRLAPGSRRNDRYGEEEMRRRQAIAARWYTWAQELFCDAVGLTIGGPAFFSAFSAHVGSMGRDDFYQDAIELYQSSHPVTRLRIQILASLAESLEYGEVAKTVTAEWDAVARTLRVVEDYHGFYSDDLRDCLAKTIGDMLVEAAPRNCVPAEVGGDVSSVGSVTLVQLFNYAWRLYRAAPERYLKWEEGTITELLV